MVNSCKKEGMPMAGEVFKQDLDAGGARGVDWPVRPTANDDNEPDRGQDDIMRMHQERYGKHILKYFGVSPYAVMQAARMMNPSEGKQRFN
jgi:hypothetical protein